MIYGDITMRQYGDLDILVDARDIAKAGALLGAHGYDPEFSIKILENKTCLNATNDLGFYNTNYGTFIELHWKLFREKIGKHLGFEKISAHQQTLKINGRSIPTLSPEMLLVYLALHGSKHAWERVEWISDIDRLVRAKTDLDWDEMIGIAQDMDTLTTLYLGLRLSYELFHTPLPNTIIPLLQTQHICRLVEKTYTMLNTTLVDNQGYARYSAIHLYQMDLLGSKRKKIRHLLATYFGISRNDCQAFPLPSSLKFLYIFIKPFRVTMKYFGQYGR
jgi:hypothetical protein